MKILETLKKSDILDEKYFWYMQNIVSYENPGWQRKWKFIDNEDCKEIIKILNSNKEIVDNTRKEIVENFIEKMENGIEIQQSNIDFDRIKANFVNQVVDLIENYPLKLEFENDSYDIKNLNYIYDISNDKIILRYKTLAGFEMILIEKVGNIWKQKDSIEYSNFELVTMKQDKENPNLLSFELGRNTWERETFEIVNSVFVKRN